MPHHGAQVEAAGAGRGGTARARRGPGAAGGVTESRLRIVAAVAGLSDEELSAYARSQGLHVDQIKQYRRDCLQADVLISKLEQDHRLEQQALEEQLRAAQRDNKAKDKTIVELAALVALAKKINAIQDIPGPGAGDPLPDRMKKLELIDEALKRGAKPLLPAPWCKTPAHLLRVEAQAGADHNLLRPQAALRASAAVLALQCRMPQ